MFSMSSMTQKPEKSVQPKKFNLFQQISHIPLILWKLLEYSLPGLTTSTEVRQTNAKWIVYFVLYSSDRWAEHSHSVEKYFKQLISPHHQESIHKFYSVNHLFPFFTYYTTYYRKFSLITFQWYSLHTTDNQEWFINSNKQYSIRNSTRTINLQRNIDDDNFTEDAIIRLLQGCFQVRKILCRSEKITDNILHTIAECCPGLRVICLYRTNVTDEGLHHLALRCPKLKKISLDSSPCFTNDSLGFLTEHCPELESINLRGCNINDNCLEHFETARCSELRTINLSEIDVINKISDKGLEFLAKGCPKITHLNIKKTKVPNGFAQTLWPTATVIESDYYYKD